MATTKAPIKAASPALQSSYSIGAILDAPEGEAILADPKHLKSFEKQAKLLKEDLHSTSKKYAEMHKK